MKFTADKAALSTLLHAAAQVADRRSTMPILANVLLRVHEGVLTVAATDIQRTTWATMPVTESANGEIALGAVDLAGIVDGMQRDTVRIERADNFHAEITAGKQRYKLIGMNAAEFPKLPKAPDGMHAIDGSGFARLLSRVAYAASTDMNRGSMAGVHIQASGATVRATTTDGHRLATATMDGEIGDVAQTIPTNAVKIIAGMVDGQSGAAIGFKSPDVFVRVGTQTFASKLLESQFPPFEQVIPKSHATRATVDGPAMAGAVKRVAAMLDKSKLDPKTKLSFGDALGIFSEGVDKGSGSEEVECTVKGPPISIGANPAYLADALGKIDGAAEIDLTDPLSPIVIRPAGDLSYFAVVMPQRL